MQFFTKIRRILWTLRLYSVRPFFRPINSRWRDIKPAEARRIPIFRLQRPRYCSRSIAAAAKKTAPCRAGARARQGEKARRIVSGQTYRRLEEKSSLAFPITRHYITNSFLRLPEGYVSAFKRDPYPRRWSIASDPVRSEVARTLRARSLSLRSTPSRELLHHSISRSRRYGYSFFCGDIPFLPRRDIIG